MNVAHRAWLWNGLALAFAVALAVGATWFVLRWIDGEFDPYKDVLRDSCGGLTQEFRGHTAADPDLLGDGSMMVKESRAAADGWAGRDSTFLPDIKVVWTGVHALDTSVEGSVIHPLTGVQQQKVDQALDVCAKY